MKKFLITYSTVDGHTKNICQKIADYSKSTQMDVLPISDVMDIKEYDFIVIGASIRYGKYRKELYDLSLIHI